MVNMKDKLKNQGSQKRSSQKLKQVPVLKIVDETPKDEKKHYTRKSPYGMLSPIAQEKLIAILGGRLIQYKAYPKDNKITIALWAELTGAKKNPKTNQYDWIIHPKKLLADSKKNEKYIKEFGWN